jgi:hypothetical protein
MKGFEKNIDKSSPVSEPNRDLQPGLERLTHALQAQRNLEIAEDFFYLRTNTSIPTLGNISVINGSAIVPTRAASANTKCCVIL